MHEEFTSPIKKDLQERGYYGLASFAVLITDHGKYLIDLNPPVNGDTTHLLLARYMALDVGLKHSTTFCYNKYRATAKTLNEKANSSNKKKETE